MPSTALAQMITIDSNPIDFETAVALPLRYPWEVEATQKSTGRKRISISSARELYNTPPWGLLDLQLTEPSWPPEGRSGMSCSLCFDFPEMCQEVRGAVRPYGSTSR